MKHKIEIELYEEHDQVNFYTLRYEGENTETDKFLEKFPEGCKYEEDIDILIKAIEQIGERGAKERYFRPEGRFGDHVRALPIQGSSLRLYLLLISEQVVVLGNGGIKKRGPYQNYPFLNDCVELLKEIDGPIGERMKKGKVNLYRKNLFGDLVFKVYTYAEEK